MTRTLVLAGKIGPAFKTSTIKAQFVAHANEPVDHAVAAAFNTQAPLVDTFDYLEDRLVGMIRREQKYMSPLVDFDFDYSAVKVQHSPVESFDYSASSPVFTMCSCPDGRECNSCK